MKKLCLLISVILVSFSNVNDCLAAQAVKIGFCMANVNDDRWLKDKEHIPLEAAKLGAEVLVFDALNNHDTQFGQVREAIEAGITILILIPVNGEKAAEIVEYAHSKDIKVISYDRLILNTNVDYYISFDPIKVGRAEASYAVGLKPEGNYMILKGPLKDYNAILFAKGQMEILKPYIESGKIKIIYEKNLLEWGDMEAFMDLQDFLPSYKGKIDVILATSDKTASGALTIMESLGLDHKYILTGQGATLVGCRNIRDGKMTMSVYKPIKDLASLAVEKAVKISRNEDLNLKNASVINNGKYDIISFLIAPQVIDQNNLSNLVADGFWTEDQLK